MAEIGNIFVRIGADISDFEKNMSAAEKAMVKVGDRFQKIGKTLSIAGAAITASMGLIIAKTANLGDEFYDLSQRTGIAVETLSSFKLAADKSGTSIGGFATGMKGLSRVMFEAASGGKEAKEAFSAVGVSATDSAGNIRPLDQVMLDVADRFATMPDGAEKSALAMKLFGKSGMDLIPMLNLGRKGLEANVEQMKKFGIVTTEEAKAGDAFNDAMTDMQAATGGLTRTIGNALIPALTSLATKVADAISKLTAFAKEHPLLTKVMGGAVLGIGGFLSALGSLSFAFGTVLKELPKLKSGFNAIKALASQTIVFTFAIAGAAIVAATIAKMIADFKKLREAGASTAEALRSQFLNFNPFKSISREGLGKFLTDMDAVRDKSISVKGAIALLGEAFRAIKGSIEGGAASLINFGEALKTLGIKTKTELTAELKAAEDALKAFRSSVEATPGQIKALEDKIIALKEAMSGVKSATIEVTETLTPLAKGAAWVRDVMQGFAGELTTTLIPAARNMIDVFDQAQPVFESAAEAAAHFVGPIRKAIVEVSDVWQGCANEMAKAFGEAFANIIRDGLTLGKFFKSLLQGMVNAVATFVGKVMTKQFEAFFTKIKVGSKEAFASFAAAAKSASIAATFAMIAVGIADFLDLDGSKRKMDEYWDHVIDEARKAGKIIYETITSAMLSAQKAVKPGPETKRINKKKEEGVPDIATEPLSRMATYEAAVAAIGQAMEAALQGTELAADKLDEAWKNLISSAKEMGQEGSTAMVALILKMREAGLQSKELTQYVLGQLDTIPNAFQVLLNNMVAAQDAKLKRMEKEWNDVVDHWIEVTPDQRVWENFTVPPEVLAKFKKQMDGYAQVALATFNGMIANGRSWMDALSALEGPLSSLKKQYEKMGIEVPKFLDPMFDALDIKKHHPMVFQNLDAATTILNGMRNAAYMTQSSFDALASSATKFARTILDVKGNLKDFLGTAKLTDTQINQLLPTITQFVGAAAAFGLHIPGWMRTFVEKNLPGMDWKEFQQRAADQANAGVRTVEELRKLYTRISDRLNAGAGWVDRLANHADSTSDKVRNVYDLLKDRLSASAGWVKTIVGAIDKIRVIETATGYSGIVSTPTLFMAGERGAEHVQVTPTRSRNTQPAGNLNFYISTIDADNFESVIRKRIAPGLRTFYRHNSNYIPMGAVGGA